MERQTDSLSLQELKEELHQYKEILDMFSNTVMGGVARMSIADMKILTATEGYYRMTGYTKEESLLPPFSNCGLNLVIPEDMEKLMSKVQILIHENKSIRADYRIRKKDGSIAWNSAFCSSVQNQDGLPCIDVFFLDTTQERISQLQNLLNEERFRIISEQTRDVIFDWDVEADIMRYSPVFEKMFGYPAPVGLSTVELLAGSLFHEEDKPIIAKMIADIRSSLPYVECKVRLLNSDGTYFWALHRATAIRDESGKCSHVVGIISDVNDLMENTLDLQRKAEHDLLTGLLNRTAGQKIIEEILSNSCKETRHAFLQFDIDRFKQINDFMGHAAGDFALQKIALQMKDLFRSDDILIRMGGDEFAIFLLNPGPRENIEKKLLEFLQTVYCNFKFGEKIYPLSISMGTSLYPEDGTTFQQLYEHADAAMYQAKRSGGNRYEFFDTTLEGYRRESE